MGRFAVAYALARKVETRTLRTMRRSALAATSAQVYCFGRYENGSMKAMEMEKYVAFLVVDSH